MASFAPTPANVLPSSGASRRQIVFGEAAVAGQQVYQNTDSKFYLADGDDATKMPVAGMAIDGGGAGQPGFIITFDPALAIGAHSQGTGIPLFASASTPGSMCPFADLGTGNLTTCVGVTNDATHIYYNPSGGVGAHA